MIKFLGIAALVLASAASAAPPAPQERVDDLLRTASVVCPLNPSREVMSGAAKDARFSTRDADLMRALCYMYHLGAEHAYEQAARILDGPAVPVREQ